MVDICALQAERPEKDGTVLAFPDAEKVAAFLEMLAEEIRDKKRIVKNVREREEIGSDIFHMSEITIRSQKYKV